MFEAHLLTDVPVLPAPNSPVMIAFAKAAALQPLRKVSDSTNKSRREATPNGKMGPATDTTCTTSPTSVTRPPPDVIPVRTEWTHPGLRVCVCVCVCVCLSVCGCDCELRDF